MVDSQAWSRLQLARSRFIRHSTWRTQASQPLIAIRVQAASQARRGRISGKQSVPVQWLRAMQLSNFIGQPRPDVPGKQLSNAWQSGPCWQLAKERRIRQSA